MKSAGIVIALLLVVAAVVYFVFLRNRDGDDETFVQDGVEITLGPAQEMSGAEFLAKLNAQAESSDSNAHFLYVEIPDPVMPKERFEKYEEPIAAILAAEELGTVDGGGTMMNAENKILYVGLDVSVIDVEKSLALISKKLRQIKAPQGTVIRYGEKDTKLHDIWEDN